MQAKEFNSILWVAYNDGLISGIMRKSVYRDFVDAETNKERRVLIKTVANTVRRSRQYRAKHDVLDRLEVLKKEYE